MEMNYNKILTDEDFMEIKQHGSSDYPFQHYYDELELFEFPRVSKRSLKRPLETVKNKKEYTCNY
jgi:hypothetical protein